MTCPEAFRPAWAEVDLAAVRANVRALCSLVAPAALLAVVKADGYGHGAVPVARAALDAGAAMLGVALVEEGVALRIAGVDAPILVLSEPVPAAAATVVEHDLVPAVYTREGIDALATAAGARGTRGTRLAVHLKIDTGMHRVGCAPHDALAMARAVVAAGPLELDGLWTHFAVADEPQRDETRKQLHAFLAAADAVKADGIVANRLHAANSAGALAWPESRLDLVRCGIAVYGIAPAPALAPPFAGAALRPALTIKARVTFVKRLPAGARLSYGLRYTMPADGWVATVPIGYADGVPRRLADRGAVALVGGRRFPIAGTVTMDQLMIDLGDTYTPPGTEVVLLGAQGDDVITADEWAERLDTIPYEVVCGIASRVPRRYVDDEPEVPA